jgi:hypothetical protein
MSQVPKVPAALDPLATSDTMGLHLTPFFWEVPATGDEGKDPLSQEFKAKLGKVRRPHLTHPQSRKA